MAFNSPVRQTASLTCLEQDKLIPPNRSPMRMIVASYRSESRLRFPICAMHIRKKGDMLYLGNAPLAAAITPLSTAWSSPAPRFQADISAMANPHYFSGY
jgi:hypothetical protein